MRQRHLFFFWLPLFASWLLMTMEGPTISAVINRLPDEVIMLAAQGLVVSLSVTIESPIINLLATSTALVRDRSSYLTVRTFTWGWMVILTLVTIILAFTPAFELIVEQLMAVPHEVSQWVRPGLRIMTFWSAAIAWRRFLQGIMIRFDLTRRVAWGTLVRLGSSAGAVGFLAFTTDLPGVIIGAIALMAGVIAEALYATVAVRTIIDTHFGEDYMQEPEQRLTYSKLFWFHLPLATTSLLILLVQPLIAFSLARLPNPTISLAAWPVVFQIMLVARAAGFALPEVVIAKSGGPSTHRPLLRFSIILATANTLAILIFVYSPVMGFYLDTVQDVTNSVRNLASSGLVLFTPLPALAIFTSWARGLLINTNLTKTVNSGMLINLVVTSIILLVGLRLQWPGIDAAAIALVVASAAELLYLWWQASSLLGMREHIISAPTAI